MSKIKVGITIGDINGVGPEVIIKALSNRRILDMCIPIIYGSSKVISYYKNIVDSQNFQFSNIQDAGRAANHKVNLVNCWDDTVNIEMGKPTADGGKYAHIAMDKALQDAKDGKIHAIATAPINKAAMKMTSFPYPGHTEFFTDQTGASTSLMTMVSDDLKVAVCTNHIPVSEVSSQLSREVIVKKLKIFNKALINDFGLQKPTIAILGLNPHAGEEGNIGTEEQDYIRPLIIEAKKNGVMAVGPYAADGFFGSSQYAKVDGILAMYHDQGLIPFKALSFGNGVNVTAGLSIVRTSPDHGTAYDIVGQNKADASSMRNAIYTSIDIVKHRNEMMEISTERIERKASKPSESAAE